MHQHAKTEEDRRNALGWIGRQLEWESRLQTLRDPEEDRDARDDDTAAEVHPAAEVNTAA
jgi:hypothetical protein